VSTSPRVRFAPSPTGSLHIGGARTALFNWLFARQTAGTFILRIEDTDAIRSTEESSAAIIRDLSALGLNWDEGPGAGGDCGPYFQSQRLDRYRAAADDLLRAGLAYRSFLSAEERERTRAARESGASADPATRYEALSADEEKRRLESGSEHAIVFKVPAGETSFVDLVRGEVSFRNEDLGDFVLVKSDGRAAYNFAAALDDFDMRITHVLRGEDHLSNTPKQILLHRALGREIPQFGHVPLILGPDKTRLSKRHGAASVQHFLERGFLPEALVNALALLGWSSPDGREILSLEELVQLFSIERIGKTAASFDPEKLEWVNAQHLARVPLEKKARLVHELITERGLREEGATVSLARAEELVALVGERMKLIPQFLDYAAFFFVEEVEPNPEEAREAMAKAGERLDLARLAQVCESTEPFDAAALEAAFRAFAEAHGMKLRDLVAPVRLALTGKRVGPGLFESMVALGKKRSLARIRRFADRQRELASSERRAGSTGSSMMEA
jgi:glutamyl-tRNA synthetase